MNLLETPKEKAPSNLAIIGLYIITQDTVDKIYETKASIGCEIRLINSLQRPNSIYGVAFEGKTYDIEQTGMA